MTSDAIIEELRARATKLAYETGWTGPGDLSALVGFATDIYLLAMTNERANWEAHIAKLDGAWRKGMEDVYTAVTGRAVTP